MTHMLRAEQKQFVESIHGFLERFAPLRATKQPVVDGGQHWTDIWKRLCQDVDIVGFAVPENLGGSGGNFEDQCLALEEMGRVLLCSPYLSSAVTSTALLLNLPQTEATRGLLARMAAGATVATVAHIEFGDSWNVNDAYVVANEDSSGYRLNGKKIFVLDGQAADIFLVVVPGEGGFTHIIGVDAHSQGVKVEAVDALDSSRMLAHITFRDALGWRLNQEDASAALELALAHGAVGLAAELVGAARECVRMSVEYAKTRCQFGRPIGSFQAIKHMCANMYVATEAAQAAARYAARALSTKSHDQIQAAHIAKAYCAQACMQVARSCIQVHGGIGFAEEHVAHLYLRRAQGSQEIYGNIVSHKEALAKELFDSEAFVEASS